MAPVKIGAPPVGVVYQLNISPGVVDEAVNVAVCPEFTACVGGVTVISGTGFRVTAPGARVVETAPVTGSVASV